jgi:hypothetical protein
MATNASGCTRGQRHELRGRLQVEDRHQDDKADHHVAGDEHINDECRQRHDHQGKTRDEHGDDAEIRPAGQRELHGHAVTGAVSAWQERIRSRGSQDIADQGTRFFHPAQDEEGAGA